MALQFDPMKEALKRKKMSGIDLTIMIGKPEDKDLEKTSDLAPDMKKEGEEEEESEELMGEGMEKPEGEVPAEFMMKGKKPEMSEEEKSDMMMVENMGSVPGSINKKAREQMMSKYKK